MDNTSPEHQLRFVVGEHGTLPRYNKAGDAALDIFSSENIVVPAKGHIVVKTAVYPAIPQGHYGQLQGRSGLAFNNDIVPFAGVIDSNFRHELRIKLFNFGQGDYDIIKGDRIAQMIILPTPMFTPVQVENLEETNREGGFGTSGR